MFPDGMDWFWNWNCDTPVCTLFQIENIDLNEPSLKCTGVIQGYLADQKMMATDIVCNLKGAI